MKYLFGVLTALLLLVPAVAEAQSALANLANSMTPGQFANLNATVATDYLNPSTNVFFPLPAGGIHAFAGVIAWDKDHHTATFYGGEHGNGTVSHGGYTCNEDNTTPYHDCTIVGQRVVRYTASTNTWDVLLDTSTGLASFLQLGGHANSSITIDPATNDVYHLITGANANYPTLQVLPYSTGTWSNRVEGGPFPYPINNPYADNNSFPAVSWWPEANGILTAYGQGQSVSFWDKASNTWSVKSTGVFGDSKQYYPGVMVYNPVTHTALASSGCTNYDAQLQRKFSIISYNIGTGAFTVSNRLLPIHILHDPANNYNIQFCIDGDSETSATTYDPSTGHFIILTRNSSDGDFVIYDYDSVADTFTLFDRTVIPTMPTAQQWDNQSLNIGGGHMAWTTIPEYGVSMFIVGTSSGVQTWLYKNVASGGTPPGVPTNLAVTAISVNQVELQWTAPVGGTPVAGYKIFQGGVQVGTSASTSFLATGLTGSTSYSFNVAAYSGTGATGSHTSDVMATTNATLLTFAQKCALSGNVNCFDFDNQSELRYNWPDQDNGGGQKYAFHICNGVLGTSGGLGYTNYQYWLENNAADPYANVQAIVVQGDCRFPVVDTSIQHSGTGSLKYPVKNHSSASAAGEFSDIFKRYMDGHQGYIGPTISTPDPTAQHLGDELWVQWYQRFDPGALQKFDYARFEWFFYTDSAGATTVKSTMCPSYGPALIPLDVAGTTVIFQYGDYFTLGQKFNVVSVASDQCSMVLDTSPTPTHAGDNSLGGGFGDGFFSGHALQAQADGWKQFGAFGNNASGTCCRGGTQISTNYQLEGLPAAYSYTNQATTANYPQQNLRTSCPSPYPDVWDNGVRYPEPPCIRYKPNQWMEFTVHITLDGTGDTPTNHFEQWIDGQKTEDTHMFWYQWGSKTDNAMGNGFGGFNLLFYPTHKDPNQDTGDFAVWYDDLIISTTPIPLLGTAVAQACTPNKLIFQSQPQNTAAGVSLGTVRIAVADASNNPCGSDTSTITVAKHAGTCVGMTLNGVTSLANIFSTSSLNLTGGTGSCSLDASDGALTGATSNTFTISSGCTPSKVVFKSQPISAAEGVSVGTIQLSVQDSGNNDCIGDTSTITITKHAGFCTGMTLNGTTFGPNVFTTSNINLTGATGSCSLDATDGALTSATSNIFTINMGGGGSGLFVRVQTVDAPSGTAPTLLGVTGGNVLVIHTESYGGLISTLSGNGNIYIHAPNSRGFWSVANTYADTWYVINANSGNTTITPSTTATNWYIVAREYSFSGGTPEFDIANYVDDGGTRAVTSSCSITTANTHDLLSSLLVTSGGSSIIAPSSWTNTLQNTTSWQMASANLEDAGTAGTKPASYSWTGGSGTYWAETCASFHIQATTCVPDHLVFKDQPPPNVFLGQSFGPVTVQVVDAGGNACLSDTSIITLTNKNGTCTGMTLGGNLSGSNVFSTPQLRESGSTAGVCTLHATDDILTPADSNQIQVKRAIRGGGRFSLRKR